MPPIMLSFIVAIALATHQQELANLPSETCETGPVDKRIGGSDWEVYGCADGLSLAVRAHELNPAFPFTFFISHPEDGAGYMIQGRGGRSAADQSERADEPAEDFADVEVQAQEEDASPAAQAARGAAGNALLSMTDKEIMALVEATKRSDDGSSLRR